MNKKLKQKITVLMAVLILATTIPAYAEPTQEEFDALHAARELYSQSMTMEEEQAYDPDNPPPTPEERMQPVIDAFTGFIATYPESELSASAQNSIAMYYFDLDDSETAKIELVKVIDNYPGSDFVDDAKYQIAFIDFTLNDYETALSGFESVITEFEGNANEALSHKVPFAYFMAGECYRKINNMINARSKWNELIAKFPTHSQAGRAQKRINP